MLLLFSSQDFSHIICLKPDGDFIIILRLVQKVIDILQLSHSNNTQFNLNHR